MFRPLTTFLAVAAALSGTTSPLAAAYPGQDDTFPFAPAAGEAGSTAIWKDDGAIVAWAAGYQDVVYGGSLAENWKTPAKALGPATGDVFDIVSLGRGGSITLTFTHPIRDGDGADFAVFENAFSDTFLELAWVEVSTDGVHFVRFPDSSFTGAPVGGFGNVDPTFVHGFAGKYRLGYGTPFDLAQLRVAHEAAVAETDAFSPVFEAQLEDNFPHLDLDEINFVRLVDVVGDGAAFDAEGFVIYDPYPTTGSAGFDLEAVAVLNQVDPAGEPQHIFLQPPANQLTGTVDRPLHVRSSSGLPVRLFIDDGPAGATVAELAPHLFNHSGTSTGVVTLRASQAGGELDGVVYAPAPDVVVTFEVVAPGSSAAPQSFADWQADHAIVGPASLDSDFDGVSDFIEYAAGTGPKNAADRPSGTIVRDAEGFLLELVLNGRALFDLEVEAATGLSDDADWADVVPEIVAFTGSAPGEPPARTLLLRVRGDGATGRFWRFRFSE